MRFFFFFCLCVKDNLNLILILIQIVPYQSLITDVDFNTIKNNLNKLIVVKLNGGLGTSMGCQGPKSSITVRDGLTFLDLTIRQLEVFINKINYFRTNKCKLIFKQSINLAYDTNVPLVLMNSFNTDEETNKIINKYNHIKVKIFTFNQSR